jgi:hypothetical protein
MIETIDIHFFFNCGFPFFSTAGKLSDLTVGCTTVFVKLSCLLKFPVLFLAFLFSPLRIMPLMNKIYMLFMQE